MASFRTGSTRVDRQCHTAVVWGEDYLHYDFGEHPMAPVRLDLTMRLARDLQVLERVQLVQPAGATESELLTVHSADYLAAVRQASWIRIITAMAWAVRTIRCSPECTTPRPSSPVARNWRPSCSGAAVPSTR